MGVIDTAMVGSLGEFPVAAAGAASSVFFLFTVFGFGLSSAVSPLVSMAAAKNDKAETAGILRGSYWAAVLISLIIMILLFLVSFFFNFLKQNAEVSEMAVSYLRIIIWSVLPMIVFLSVKQFADGLSFTRSSMLITLLAIPTNAFLNWLLIYGNWGMPELGLDGAGYATLITRVFMMLAMILFVHRSKGLHSFVINKPKLVGSFTRKVFRIGVPSGFQYFFEVAAFGTAMIMAGWIGVAQQAAHQIAINTAALTYMAVTGLSAAGSIRVGAAFGGYAVREVRIAGKSAVILGAVWMLLCGIGLALFRTQIAGLFIGEADVLFWAEKLLLIAAMFQLSDGIQAIGLGILRGISDVRIPTLITLFAYWIIGIPMAWILGFHSSLSIEGIWIGLSFALSVSAGLLYWRFNRLSRLKAE